MGVEIDRTTLAGARAVDEVAIIDRVDQALVDADRPALHVDVVLAAVDVGRRAPIEVGGGEGEGALEVVDPAAAAVLRTRGLLSPFAVGEGAALHVEIARVVIEAAATAVGGVALVVSNDAIREGAVSDRCGLLAIGFDVEAGPARVVVLILEFKILEDAILDRHRTTNVHPDAGQARRHRIADGEAADRAGAILVRGVDTTQRAAVEVDDGARGSLEADEGDVTVGEIDRTAVDTGRHLDQVAAKGVPDRFGDRGVFRRHRDRGVGALAVALEVVAALVADASIEVVRRVVAIKGVREVDRTVAVQAATRVPGRIPGEGAAVEVGAVGVGGEDGAPVSVGLVVGERRIGEGRLRSRVDPYGSARESGVWVARDADGTIPGERAVGEVHAVVGQDRATTGVGAARTAGTDQIVGEGAVGEVRSSAVERLDRAAAGVVVDVGRVESGGIAREVDTIEIQGTAAVKLDGAATAVVGLARPVPDRLVTDKVGITGSGDRRRIRVQGPAPDMRRVALVPGRRILDKRAVVKLDRQTIGEHRAATGVVAAIVVVHERILSEGAVDQCAAIEIYPATAEVILAVADVAGVAGELAEFELHVAVRMCPATAKTRGVAREGRSEHQPLAHPEPAAGTADVVGEGTAGDGRPGVDREVRAAPVSGVGIAFEVGGVGFEGASGHLDETVGIEPATVATRGVGLGEAVPLEGATGQNVRHAAGDVNPTAVPLRHVVDEFGAVGGQRARVLHLEAASGPAGGVVGKRGALKIHARRVCGVDRPAVGGGVRIETTVGEDRRCSIQQRHGAAVAIVLAVVGEVLGVRFERAIGECDGTARHTDRAAVGVPARGVGETVLQKRASHQLMCSRFHRDRAGFGVGLV